MEEGGDEPVQHTWMLEPVDGSKMQTHVIRISGSEESGRLLAKHLLDEMTIKECIGNIQMMHGPCVRHRKL